MTSFTDTGRRRAAPVLGTFERYLTVWVALCIIAGIMLGRLMPAPFQALGRMTVAEVNMPVAALIWLMIVPMLIKVDFGALHRVAEQWRGIAVTVGINWLVKPFTMAVLGWLFIGWIFRPWLPETQIDRYIVVPVITAQLWRRSLLASGGDVALTQTLRRLQPVSLVALLATLVLLFGFQGEEIVRQPLIIALLAVPIVIQVYLNAGIAYGLNRALGVPHNVAGPSALIGASNFFELAVAAAIALFGFQSGAALATVVGVLVEVPVMLSVVRIVLRSRRWYERD